MFRLSRLRRRFRSSVPSASVRACWRLVGRGCGVRRSSVAAANSGRSPASGSSRHHLRIRTWVTASNHRRITAPHTRTFNHGAALVVRLVVSAALARPVSRSFLAGCRPRTFFPRVSRRYFQDGVSKLSSGRSRPVLADFAEQNTGGVRGGSTLALPWGSGPRGHQPLPLHSPHADPAHGASAAAPRARRGRPPRRRRLRRTSRTADLVLLGNASRVGWGDECGERNHKRSARPCLIIARTTRRCSSRPVSRRPAGSTLLEERRLRLLEPGRLVQCLRCPVVGRDVMPLPVLSWSRSHPPALLPEVVLPPHPQDRAHPREAVEHDGEQRPVSKPRQGARVDGAWGAMEPKVR